MKFAFLLIAIFINFFNQSLIKSEEKIFSANNKIENIARKESITSKGFLFDLDLRYPPYERVKKLLKFIFKI